MNSSIKNKGPIYEKNTVALSAVAAAIMFATSAQAAEVYNKNSNKLDLYGRITALHYFSNDQGNDGDQTYARLGFKGETQINDQLTGFGQWEYQFSGNKTESDGAAGNKTRLAFAGLKYDANNIYMAAIYSETQNMTTFGEHGIADQAQNFEAVAQYQFDFGLRPSLAFIQSNAKDVLVGGVNYGDQDLVKYIDVGATYYFNKNMSAYVDYKINLIDENKFTEATDIATDNIVAVGMTYQF
ncbi:porin [Escherichia coli]|nr:porin [Escherichia coli]